MPLYKDKAARFANAFEHLMQDSDDDDELETSQTERPSANKNELKPGDEDSIEVLQPEEDSNSMIRPKPQEESSVIEPSSESEVISEIQVHHQIDKASNHRKESPPKRQRTNREPPPIISPPICSTSSPITRSGARRRPLRKCVADKQKQKPPVEFISLSSDDDNNDDDFFEICHVEPTKNPRRSTIATGDSSIRLDSSLCSTELCGTEILDASFEDYEFKLKIFQYGTYVQYKTTWKTKLKDALKVLIDDLAKSGRCLLLTRSEETQPLSLDETPQSLNFHSGTILHAIAVSECSTTDTKTNLPQKSTHDPNILTLKLQDGQRKHLKEFQIGKSEPLRILKEKYAKEFNHDLDRMKLCFDGDPVRDQDTPEELDIDDDCVLDVLIMANL